MCVKVVRRESVLNGTVGGQALLASSLPGFGDFPSLWTE